MVVEDKIFTVMIRAPKQGVVSLIHPETAELQADVKETSPSTRPDPNGNGCCAL